MKSRPVSRKFRPVLNRFRIAAKKVLEDWDCVKEEVNPQGFALIDARLLEELDEAFVEVEAAVDPFIPDGIKKPEAA